MKNLGPIIDEAEQVEDVEPAALEGLERLRAVLALCGKRLGGSDPIAMSPTPLDAIAGSLESAKTEVEAFVKDHNAAHLTTANGMADSALGQLAQVPAAATPEDLVGLIQGVNSHREVLERQARSSSEARKKAESEIKVLRSSLETFTSQSQATIANLQALLEAERQKISAQASEQQKLFADAQEGRSNTYNETLRKVQENLSQTLTEHQRQFSEAQENRNREFTAAQTDSHKRFGELVSDYTKRLADQDAEFTKQRDAFVNDSKKRLQELHKGYVDEAESVLKKVNARREEVEKLVGVIGSKCEDLEGTWFHQFGQTTSG